MRQVCAIFIIPISDNACMITGIHNYVHLLSTRRTNINVSHTCHQPQFTNTNRFIHQILLNHSGRRVFCIDQREKNQH